MKATVNIPDRTQLVAIAGDASLESNSIEASIASEIGVGLMEGGYRLVTGGLGGVMEAACRGARSSPAWKEGTIIGILPGHDTRDANTFVDVAIPTGLDVGRNILVAHADALFAIGGGAGTLTEIAMAWQMHRLVIGFRGHGWSGRLADRRVDERVRYPEITDDRVFGFDTAQQALEILRDRISQYRRAYNGIVRRRLPFENSDSPI